MPKVAFDTRFGKFAPIVFSLVAFALVVFALANLKQRNH